MTITDDLFRLTQSERILKLLQMRGGLGVKVYEIMAPRPDGLGVAQYNARIKELREKGYNIVNVVPGHFVLSGMSSSAYQPMINIHSSKSPVRDQWKAVGAYLHGEGPKPNRDSLLHAVQETLL